MPNLHKSTSKLGKARKGTWNGIPCFEYQGNFYFHARTFVGFPEFAKQANHGGMILSKYVDQDSPRVEIKRAPSQTQVRGYSLGDLRRFIAANNLSRSAAWKPLLSTTGWVSGHDQTEVLEEIKHDAKEIEPEDVSVNLNESENRDKSLVDILHQLAVKVTGLEAKHDSLLEVVSDYERETAKLRELVEGYEMASERELEKKRGSRIKLEALDEKDLVNILTLIAKAIG